MLHKHVTYFKGTPINRTSVLDAVRRTSAVVGTRLVVLRVVLSGFQGVLEVGS